VARPKNWKAVYLPEGLRERFKAEAHRRGLSIPEFIEELLRLVGSHERVGSSRTPPVYKAMTSSGELAYVIIVDGTSIMLTYTELRALCRSGLVDVGLCLKTILA
jgi:hypothetical protein